MPKFAIRWASHPADQNRIEQLPGISEHTWEGIPAEGETIVNPFLVDPITRLPCPLIVSRILWEYSEDYLVVVVSRAQ